MNSPDRSAALHSSAADALRAASVWINEPGERRMMATVISWLARVGWLGSGTSLALEVPWRGRRIDMVTSSAKGRLTAFEFKLGSTGRALEQAAYNSLSAHRSFVVLGGSPSDSSLAAATELGLGVIVVNGGIQLLKRPQAAACDETLARGLRECVRKRSDVRTI
jgi:hypothetical protein